MKAKAFLLASTALAAVMANATKDMDHINNMGATLHEFQWSISQEFSDFPTYSSMVLDDFNASGSIVTSVDMAFEATNPDAFFSNIKGWQLSIFANPVDGISSGPNLNLNTVAQTYVSKANVISISGTSASLPTYMVVLNGLNLNLGSTGHYWVGIAADMDFNAGGQIYTLGNSSPLILGAGTANDAVMVNPGGSFGTIQAAGDNAAYRVETKAVPEPASIAAVFTGLIGLIARRRK